jgi:Asp-tRNA(Asn)/Glu-tRNA(Gln) amidotransferase A subunit family amidase
MRDTRDRMDRVNPGLNAFVALRPEAALVEAAAMTENIASGKNLGPWPACHWGSRIWRIPPAW